EGRGRVRPGEVAEATSAWWGAIRRNQRAPAELIGAPLATPLGAARPVRVFACAKCPGRARSSLVGSRTRAALLTAAPLARSLLASSLLATALASATLLAADLGGAAELGPAGGAPRAMLGGFVALATGHAGFSESSFTSRRF